MSLLGWEGGWYSPERLLKGSGTVPGFIQDWVVVGCVDGCPCWAGRGVGIVQDDC